MFWVYRDFSFNLYGEDNSYYHRTATYLLGYQGKRLASHSLKFNTENW